MIDEKRVVLEKVNSIITYTGNANNFAKTSIIHVVSIKIRILMFHFKFRLIGSTSKEYRNKILITVMIFKFAQPDYSRYYWP